MPEHEAPYMAFYRIKRNRTFEKAVEQGAKEQRIRMLRKLPLWELMEKVAREEERKRRTGFFIDTRREVQSA